MDAERDELVAALRQKLTELDAQVVAYRRERADEFRRYATDLLKPVSDGVTAEVAALIEGPSSSTTKDFDALYPGFVDAGDGTSILAPPPPSRAQIRRTISPPPVLYHTSGVPKEGPRRPLSDSISSLHSRDEEVQGLFTPPFLPLLDSSSYERRPQSIDGVYNESLADSAVQSEADAAAAVKEAAAAEAAAVNEAAARAAALTPPEPKLKGVLRRTSSISSSRSSTPTIKPPPQNTRHVRFSFGGEEVLPTASPPKPMQQDLSWLMHDDGNRDYDDMDYENAGIQRDYIPDDIQSGILAEDSLAEASSISAADNSFDPELHGPESTARGWGVDHQETNGLPQGSESQLSAQTDSTAPLSNPGQDQSQTQSQTQNQSQTTAPTLPPLASSSSTDRPQPRRQGSKILDDDEYDFAPLARKISSSDRLRALSKMPLEDPSIWTVVNPQSSSAAGSSASPLPSVTDVISTHHQRRLSLQQDQEQLPTVEQVEDTERPQVTTEADTRNGYNSSDDSDDDEGFIAMRPARKQSISLASPTAETPSHHTQAEAPVATPNGSATRESDKGKDVDSDSSRPKESTSTGKPVQVQFADSVIGDGDSKPKAEAPAALDDDNDFFEFEEDGDESVGYPLSRATKVNTDFHHDHSDDENEPDADDDDHDEEDTEDPAEAQPTDSDADLVAKEKAALGIGNDGLDSNALAFNHRKILGAATNEGGISRGLSSSGSSTPPGPPLGASVGSYRGRNIDLFNVVKDPRVLQQAAQLGDMNSFVGSIHDGHQPSTMAEFSSLTGPERLNLMSGTPRSLTERMAMEDVRKNFMSPSARNR